MVKAPGLVIAGPQAAVLRRVANRLLSRGVRTRNRSTERPAKQLPGAPGRHEYALARRGVELWPALMTIKPWRDRHLGPDGPPMLILHTDCGGELDGRLHCSRCGAELGPTDVHVEPGPGLVAPPAAVAAGA